MKNSGLVLFMLVSLAGLTMFHCSDLGQPIISPVEHGNFVLYVVNESVQINPVEVQVCIDGRCAVAQEFRWNNAMPKQFEFLIEEGKHTLRATSAYAPNGFSAEFTRSSTPYATVTFWSDPAPPAFTIHFSAEPPGFQ